jgi:hypothetical protein
MHCDGKHARHVAIRAHHAIAATQASGETMKRPIMLLAAAATALAVDATSVLAAPANQILACRPNRADVADVAVNDLRFGIGATYVWATATIRLTMRDRTAREYSVSGRADPLDKPLRPNRAVAGFTYPGFTCTVQYGPIASVRNCTGMNKHRSCEIGLTIFGMPVVYAVSMTADRATKVVEASAP